MNISPYATLLLFTLLKTGATSAIEIPFECYFRRHRASGTDASLFGLDDRTLTKSAEEQFCLAGAREIGGLGTGAELGQLGDLGISFGLWQAHQPGHYLGMRLGHPETPALQHLPV
jgi:hypothetical protein